MSIEPTQPEAGQEEVPTGPTDPRERVRRRVWLIGALLVYLVAAGLPNREVLREGIATTVAMNRIEIDVPESGREAARIALINDQYFVVWLLARNAWTWTRAPTDLFSPGICFPTPRVLALGEPMLTLGALGALPYRITRDPILTYNLTLLFLLVLSALAMYWLVTEWTGVPAAGFVAGLLYAYHPARIYDVSHPYISDSVWTVFALFFARRVFERGRIRDGVGLGLAIAAQAGGSIYPLVAAALVGGVFFGWLLVRYGVPRRALLPLAAASVIGLVAGYLALGPFLEASEAGQLSVRPLRGFAIPANFMPGAYYFPGWPMLLLCIAGVALPIAEAWRRRDGRRLLHTPALFLVLASVLVYLTATASHGRFEPTTFHLLLAKVIPGLEVVRAPARIIGGFHVALSLLAGLGAAASIRSVPTRLHTAVACVGAAMVAISLAVPALAGLPAPLVYEALPLRPDAERLAFYTGLREAGVEGAILELPAPPSLLTRPLLLAQAWHHLPTSTCGGQSFKPPQTATVIRLGKGLPDRRTRRRLESLGFEAVVLHRGLIASQPWAEGLERQFDRISHTLGDEGLRIHADEASEAFRLFPRRKASRAGD